VTKWNYLVSAESDFCECVAGAETAFGNERDKQFVRCSVTLHGDWAESVKQLGRLHRAG
jgi:hypothetical protein